MGGIMSQLGLVDEDPKTSIKLDLLKAMDSNTTTAVIQLLSTTESFIAFAKAEGDGIMARDSEDDEKLAKGIELARAKKVLDNKPPAPYTQVDVLGKTANEVADEMIAHLGPDFKGGVLVLVGLSGTGKGTTVDKLKQKIEGCVTWSNGNVFRSLTLLAATHCAQTMGEGQFDPACLTAENLATWMGMLEFGKFNGKFDTKISGLGMEHYVSEVANTVLKGPMVRGNIPTVAEVTQGEVVKFASAACKTMGEAGVTVLLEGRAQTVNYIESPHRFELTLSDPTLIGKRLAAQRIAGRALELIGTATDDHAVVAAIALALGQLSAEAK